MNELAEHGVPFRALVRPQSDASSLRELGADIRIGGLTDRAGLDRGDEHRAPRITGSGVRFMAFPDDARSRGS